MVSRYENSPINYNFVIAASQVIKNIPKSATTEKTEGVGKQFFSRMRDFFSSNSVKMTFIVEGKAHYVTITGDRSQIKFVKQMLKDGDPTDFGISVAKIISETLKIINPEKSIKKAEPEAKPSPPPYPGKNYNYQEDEIPTYDQPSGPNPPAGTNPPI